MTVKEPQKQTAKVRMFVGQMTMDFKQTASMDSDWSWKVKGHNLRVNKGALNRLHTVNQLHTDQ